ncbi:hypothetical protein E2C01_048399 [Portunus trituberculatus]|uniref:Uncharacterized protein n=1 Tax=Portunus trituberculatus TaxID=210409 RepID=A0A5B7G3Q1_PORTR|nr:hypothetical protein [Portunus trituberculatus]
MAGRQDTQWECSSKASPGNHLLHPTQQRVAMVTQGEVEMEVARKWAPKKAGRSKKRSSTTTLNSYFDEKEKQDSPQEIHLYYKNYVTSTYNAKAKALKKIIHNIKPVNTNSQIKLIIYYKTKCTSSNTSRVADPLRILVQSPPPYPSASQPTQDGVINHADTTFNRKKLEENTVILHKELCKACLRMISSLHSHQDY